MFVEGAWRGSVRVRGCEDLAAVVQMWPLDADAVAVAAGEGGAEGKPAWQEEGLEATGEIAGTLRAVQAIGIEITSIRDVTPIPHNGCRPKKSRRV